MEQRCGRIDIETGAYHQHDIRRGSNAAGLVEIRHSFAEENDVRPEERTVRMAVAVVLLPSLQRHRGYLVDRRTQFGDLAVQVNDAGGSGTLMQVVDVLRDDTRLRHRLLQPRDSHVRCIGLGRQRVTPAVVVKLDAQLRVGQPRLMRTHIFHTVVLPQTVTVAEGTQTALGTHAGSGKNNNLRHKSIYDLTIYDLRFYDLLTIYVTIADDASYTMPYNDYLPEQGYDFENSAAEPYNPQDAESTQLQQPLIENNPPAALSESTALPTVAGITPIDSSNIPTLQAKKSHKKWWIWVLIVLIIAGLGYFGWNIWSKKSKTAALKSCQSAATALTTANNNVENAIKNAQSAASLSSADVLDTSLLASLQKAVNTPTSMVLTCPTSESAETLHSNATTMNNDVTQMNNLAAKIQSETSSVQSSQQAKSLSVARNKLTAEISTANQILSSNTGKVANSSTIQALQQAISEAQSVANNSSATLEQITSSQTTLQQMIASVKASAQQLEEQQAAAAQAAEQAQQQNSTNSNSNSNTTDTNNSGKSTSQSTTKQNSSSQSSTDKTTNNSSQSNSSTQTKKDKK